MGLGIRREMVGDILTGPQGADLLLMGEIVPYVAQNLQKVGNAPVACTPLPLSQLEPPPLKVKVLRDTVACLRLDAVLTVAFSESPQRAAELVRRGLVQVDGLEMTKPDRPVEQGARISARGKGKAILYAVGGLSEKGRQMIEVHETTLGREGPTGRDGPTGRKREPPEAQPTGKGAPQPQGATIVRTQRHAHGGHQNPAGRPEGAHGGTGAPVRRIAAATVRNPLLFSGFAEK